MAETYSAELKAQVIAAVQLGESKSAVAKRFGISRGAVQLWTRGSESIAVLPTQKREDLGELVFTYLAEGLKALIAQARAMGDPEWFKGQGETTYLLHGTLADKLVIIFQGVERGRAEQADEAGGGVHPA